MNNYCEKCNKIDFNNKINFNNRICDGPGHNISLCIDRYNNFTNIEQNIHDSDTFKFNLFNTDNFEQSFPEYDPSLYNLPVSIGKFATIYPQGYNNIDYLYTISDNNHNLRKFIPPPNYGLLLPICDKIGCIRNYY